MESHELTYIADYTLEASFGQLELCLGERQMGIYQGLSEYKPDAQASASILAYTRLRFGLVLVRNYLPLALPNKLRMCDSLSINNLVVVTLSAEAVE